MVVVQSFVWRIVLITSFYAEVITCYVWKQIKIIAEMRFEVELA